MSKYIRITDPKSIDSTSVLSQTTGDNEVTIQFSETVTDHNLLRQVDELCKSAGTNLCIRFYGHDQTGFDCNILSYLPNVKNLSVNCLRSVSNFAALRELENIEKLNVGIDELDEKDFLSWENLKQVSSLCLGSSRKNNVDLKYLDEYANVESFFLNGHSKNIDAVGAMSRVAELSLSISAKASISFVNRLAKLRKFKLVLGGRDNLDEVTNYGIEEIEIVRVRGFSSFGNLGEFKKLKKLLIEDQIRIEELRIPSELPNLAELKIFNCKTLSVLEGLHNLVALQHLRINMTAIEYSDFIKQKLPNSLKILAFYTKSEKSDLEIRNSLDRLGYVDR